LRRSVTAGVLRQCHAGSALQWTGDQPSTRMDSSTGNLALQERQPHWHAACNLSSGWAVWCVLAEQGQVPTCAVCVLHAGSSAHTVGGALLSWLLSATSPSAVTSSPSLQGSRQQVRGDSKKGGQHYRVFSTRSGSNCVSSPGMHVMQHTVLLSAERQLACSDSRMTP
jgi:hypothetical protein